MYLSLSLDLGAVAMRLVHCAHHAAAASLEGAVLVRVGVVRVGVGVGVGARVKVRVRVRAS